MVEIIRKNTLQFLTVNYFLEKFPLKMFYRILNKPPMLQRYCSSDIACSNSLLFFIISAHFAKDLSGQWSFFILKKREKEGG